MLMAEQAEKEQDRRFKEQFEDESVLLVFRKHPVVMRKGLILSSVAILLGVVPSLFKPEFSWFFGGLGAGFLLAFIVFLPFWIAWYYSVYIVTDQRLIQITQKGLFNRSMVGLGLDQIQMVNYEVAGLQETLLGYGTIVVQTYVGSLTIHEVHHPAKIQKELLEILREQGISTSLPMNKPANEGNEEE
jgi:uncharacterized membrane protein YdbT with pleckstrin-like domain